MRNRKRTGWHRVVTEKVPLTDVAPTILAHFGVAQPAHLRGRPLPLGPGAAARDGVDL